MSHWFYRNSLIDTLPEDCVGFVYLITNLKDGRKYIGRKYAVSTKRKPLTKKQKDAGRVRRDIVKKESDWRTYTGSNKQLNEDIDRLGKDSFRFEILYFAETKGQINYIEVNLQHKHDVILRSDYYNDAIGSKDFIALRNNEKLKEMLLENNS
jgi:hypothetical protein